MNDELTSREREILDLMVKGLSSREIAVQLILTYETVRWYNKQIYAKLDVHSRKEAIRKAQALGIGSAEQTLTRTRHNLPADSTPFVGREDEIAEIGDLLRGAANRLITIIAPGGMGKTRLALIIARQRIGAQFPAGVYFVPLVALADPASIVTAIAEATDYQFQQDKRSPKRQILDYLSEKRMLLVLDNFEHLRSGAAIIVDILEAAPKVKIIVTSRERLNLSSATVYNLQGLAYSQSSLFANVLDYDASQLFIESARRKKLDFEPRDKDLSLVAQICQMVEGMPLAIILAATWVEVLSLREIAGEIQQSVDFLAVEMGDIPRRQWSIRAVFEPTWNRLNEEQRRTFMKLAVFRGGCTREAAQSVTDGDLRDLQLLIDKSLLQLTYAGRYEVHELLRQYAEEHLKKSQMFLVTRTAHSHYYGRFTQEQEQNIKGRDQLSGLNALETDFENVQAAWRWAVSQDIPEILDKMMEGFFWYCTFRGRLDEGGELFQQARQQWPVSQDAAPITGRLLVRFPRDSQDVLRLYEQGLTVAREHNNQYEIAFCLQKVGKHLSHELHDERGLPMLEESLAKFEQLGDVFYAAQVLDDIGWSYALIGKRDERLAIIRRSIELRQNGGDKIGEAAALRNLSSTYMMQGQAKEANEYIQAAKLIARQMHDQTNLIWTSLMFGVRMALQGETDESQAAIDEGLSLAIHMNNPNLKTLGYVVLGLLQGTVGEYATGRRTIEQGIKYEDLEQADFPIRMFGCVAAALSEYGLGNVQAAKYFLRIGLHNATYIVPSPAMITWNFPVLVLVLANGGFSERVIEVLALTLTHPARHCWWADTWRPILQLQSDLKAEFGEAAYTVAWARGKSLDLFNVTKEILNDFDEVKDE